MDLNHISSTCETDGSSKLNQNYSAVCDPRATSIDECESVTDDSENETIDVICENSDRGRCNEKLQNLIPIPFINGNKGRIYEQTRVIIPGKIRSDSVINAKSKTFLIDSILGNDKNSDEQSPIDSEQFEETADEHNGK